MMTYQQLKDILDTMDAEQLQQSVVTYSGDIDDTIRVIGTSFNSDDEMGESLDTYPQQQFFLVLE